MPLKAHFIGVNRQRGFVAYRYLHVFIFLCFQLFILPLVSSGRITTTLFILLSINIKMNSVTQWYILILTDQLLQHCNSLMKLLPQQSHDQQWSSSHHQWSSSHCCSAINAGRRPSVQKWGRGSEHQEELKSDQRLSLLKRTERRWEIQSPAESNTLKILNNKQVGVYSSFMMLKNIHVRKIQALHHI